MTQPSQASQGVLGPMILTAETNDVRPFARLLRGIGLKHNAVMTITEAGFEVTVEEVKTLCAIAFIPHNLFQTFTYNPPTPTQGPACFELSLDALLRVLNIFGNANTGPATATNYREKRRWAGEGEGGEEEAGAKGGGGKGGRTGMIMKWQGPGWPLSVLLKDDSKKGPTTDCALKVSEPEELMNQVFDADECVLYLIMKSEWFRDALSDLPPTSTKITLKATPASQGEPQGAPSATSSSNARHRHRAHVGQFQIEAKGDFGTTQLDYPNDKEVMDRFDCMDEVTFSYHSSHFNLLARALNQSAKMCLQIESSGFLSIQIMMPTGGGTAIGDHAGILEFKMHALEDDD